MIGVKQQWKLRLKQKEEGFLPANKRYWPIFNKNNKSYHLFNMHFVLHTILTSPVQVLTVYLVGWLKLDSIVAQDEWS